ncbi:MAG: type II secretion system protein [Candidatus Microsaccharimonas sp.]
MLGKRHMLWAQKQTGFTIVELLIVVVVIAILAAITIVSYDGIQQQATDTAVKMELENLAKQYGMFHAVNSRYPASAEDLEALDVSFNKSLYMVDPQTNYNLVTCYSMSSGNEYGVAAITKNGTFLYITNGSGVMEYTGATNWIGLNRYTAMCSSISSSLPLSYIPFGPGYGSGWRPWTDG